MLRLSRRATVRATVLPVVLIVLASLLGCTGYGTLVHHRIVIPPSVHLRVGAYEVFGDMFPSLPCSERPYCNPSDTNAQQATYDIWLFVDKTHPSDRPQAILLFQLPLAAPQSLPRLHHVPHESDAEQTLAGYGAQYGRGGL
jgi:hypothetical protein